MRKKNDTPTRAKALNKRIPDDALVYGFLTDISHLPSLLIRRL